MNTIYSIKPMNYDQLPGSAISHVMTEADKLSEVSVIEMKAGSTIKPHTHKVDAYMFILNGTATVLSDDENNGRAVAKGDCVFFKALKPHGFRAGKEGMSFLSINGGILQQDGSLDFVS